MVPAPRTRLDTILRLLTPEWKAAWKKRLDEGELFREFTRWVSSTEWTWFVTQTFRRSYSLRAVSRVFYHFLAGSSLSSTPKVVLWAAELGKSGSRAHLHMLWEWSETQQRRWEKGLTPSSQGSSDSKSVSSPAWKLWKELLYARVGIARIFPFDKDRGAIPYLSKYVLKGVDKVTGEDTADWGIWTF